MTDNYELIRGRSLTSLCVPGSHDAGMSVLNVPTLGASACDTLTQARHVSDQLNAGSRYFDIRPGLWSAVVDVPPPKLALCACHFTKPGYVSWATGLLGGFGQYLESILGDVSAFLQQPGSEKEIVILKFSHYADYDTTAFQFTEGQMEQLVTQVTARLQNQLYTDPSPSVNLNALTVDQILNGSGRVIAVFDELSEDLHVPSLGLFSYSDYSGTSTPPADLIVYDSYSNTHSLSFMEADQLGKFASFDPASGSLFLVSWTLTMQPADFEPPMVCISTLAQQANNDLPNVLPTWVTAGFVSASKVPNIIYCDWVTPTLGVVDVCVAFNQLGA